MNATVAPDEGYIGCFLRVEGFTLEAFFDGGVLRDVQSIPPLEEIRSWVPLDLGVTTLDDVRAGVREHGWDAGLTAADLQSGDAALAVLDGITLVPWML